MPNYKGCPFCSEYPKPDERILITYDGMKWYAHPKCYENYISEIKRAVDELISQGKW